MSSAGRYRRRRVTMAAVCADAVEIPLASSIDPTAGLVPLSHPGLWRASVVVPTHNDGPNIAALLEGVLSEPSVGEVVVIASECRDATVDRVREVAATAHGRVRLFVEETRSGKASAINFAVAECHFDRVLIISGDVLPRAGAVEQLIDALDDPTVGLAGARPVPVDGDSDVMGVAVTVLWELHHRLALRRPKLGEAIAMRIEAIEPLPRTAVDEATFQAVVEQAGWRSAYVPDAIVLNRGPRTARDFVRQRRRTHAGHLRLRRTNHYTVPSLDPTLLVKEFCGLLIADRRRINKRWAAGLATAVSLEVCARLLARVDELRRKDLHVWTIVESAKHPAAGPHRVGADGSQFVASPGVAAASPGERDDQHELPMQLHVRDVQRVRAESRRA
jgi:biofilm PGA synthesis N-glycosyltransferase PgaC